VVSSGVPTASGQWRIAAYNHRKVKSKAPRMPSSPELAQIGLTAPRPVDKKLWLLVLRARALQIPLDPGIKMLCNLTIF